jgi:3-hydroxybutyryl-CoA dehydrogenase
MRKIRRYDMDGDMKIGIVGAGVMGRGVAVRFASYGYPVVIKDISGKKLEEARHEITRQLKLMGMMNQDMNPQEVMERIQFTERYEDMVLCGFIIENVPEEVGIKEAVYKELELYIPEDCIYMVNTSCIPITQVSSYTDRPHKVIGVHFMNPVPMKKFSEVIRGVYTSDDTVERVGNLMGSVEIEIEVIHDSAGFVSNRLSHLFMNEAAFLVYEGVAEAKQIDKIFKEGFGHRMGPLETADLIGLDTVLDSLKILYDHYEDSKYRACPLLKQMVSAGLTGRKNGKGFYAY